MNDDALAPLRLAYRAHRLLPFPRGSPNLELHAVYAELHDYDGYVAGIADTVLNGGSVEVRMLYPDIDLDVRTNAVLHGDVPESIRERAREYAAYLDSLSTILTEVRKLQASL